MLLDEMHGLELVSRYMSDELPYQEALEQYVTGGGVEIVIFSPVSSPLTAFMLFFISNVSSWNSSDELPSKRFLSSMSWMGEWEWLFCNPFPHP